MDKREIVAKDLRHVWHPCSQMSDYEDFPPLLIERAEGPYLILADGKKIIDAVSSWWCKSLGHGHPRIRRAVTRQMERYEHIIAANACQDILAELSEKLSALCLGLDRAFYAGDGSVAVEVAMKMSLQYHAQTGRPERKVFVALKNGYHGETLLTLAAGDCELYSQPYRSVMPTIPKIGPIPFVSGPRDPAWGEISGAAWEPVKRQLEAMEGALSGIMFEPILQGAGNMMVYSPDFLRKLRDWATPRGIHLIADEIMTGFGRTGEWLACDHAGVKPDFVALSKGLTSGWAPFSAVMTSTEVYKAFWGDYFSGKAFLHSNTYSGYALGAAAALETIQIYQDEDIVGGVRNRAWDLRSRLEQVAAATGCLRNLRGVGFAVAADLVDPSTGEPFPKEKRVGYQCFQHALELGAWLRPLGDSIYFLPPLNTPDPVLDALADIATNAIKKTIEKA